MDSFEKGLLTLQIRNLEEQIRTLRKEKEFYEKRIQQLEESVSKILKSEECNR